MKIEKDVDVTDLRGLNLIVRVRVTQGFRLRVWILRSLMLLAARVTRANIKVEAGQ